MLPGCVITRVGPSQNPQYTRAHFGGEAAGCSLTLQHHNNEPKKTQHNDNMVAEQVLCDLSVRRTVCVHGVCRCSCAQQRVSMESADVLDVSNAVRSDDLSNVVLRAETLWQCKLGFSTDKMVGVNRALTARCRWNVTSSDPAECQNSDNCVGNRCGSHGVCRDKATPTVVHLDYYTCECDSGFELKSTAVAIDNVDHVPSKATKLSTTSVMCSACRVSSVTAESRREICRTTSRCQIARALRNESNQATENTFYCQTALAEQKALHQQSAALRRAQVANAI